MGTKIYLSPSSQKDNAYAYGGTTEAEQCKKIAQYAEKYLKANGYSVKRGGTNTTVSERIKESNNFGADVHIPIHTNAGGGDGTLVMCYSSCSDNKYVKNVYSEVAKLSPGKDDGIRVNNSLSEITGTTAMCVYVECEFHDGKTLAKWITENTDAIGKAICRGICKADGKTMKETGTTTSGSAITGALYKVQCGAFKEQENAEALVKELKAKGNSSFAYKADDGLYKVQAGAFSKKSNADAKAKALTAQGFSAYVYKE